MSAPQSRISMCSGVRLNSRYEHTIYFPTAEAQEAYFAGKETYSFSAYTFLRKSWPLRVQATMQRAKTWNYCFFRNSEDSKNYYYFVSNVEYINDYTVELTLELDVLQTYLFDMELLPCFVERQHTETDVIGEHTVDEGLDVGELTVNGSEVRVDPGDLAIMVMCSTNPNATSEAEAVRALPYMYNGVFSGVKLWAVDPARWASWGHQIDTLTEIGKSDAITAMWMYPKGMIKLGGEASWTGDEMAVPVEGAKSYEETTLWNIPKNLAKLDGYTPRNKKLFCYPFNFLYVNNNSGISAVYRYERSDADGMGFKLSGSVSPDGGVKLTPVDYNGLEYNYHEGMEINGYPSCAWDSDVYKLWLAQNQNQNRYALSTGVGKIVAGVGMVAGSAGLTATGLGSIPGGAGMAAGGGLALSGLQQITELVVQHRDREIEPPQAKGGFSSSVNITDDHFCFSMLKKSVTAETAKIIDDFFSLYGYKINQVKVPNLCARSRYTYVKTVGCHIRGKMCNEDIITVETIFDRGITWWAPNAEPCTYINEAGVWYDNTPVEV